MNSQQRTNAVISVTSLLDPTLKVKQLYIRPVQIKQMTIFREEVVLSADSRYNIQHLTRVLRVMLRHGVFTSEYEDNSDDLQYASYVRLLFESGTPKDIQSVLRPLVREFIGDDLVLKSTKTSIEVSYVDTNKPPIKAVVKVYPPLDLLCSIEAYGIVESDGVSSYIYSVSLDGVDVPQASVKRKVCLRCLLPTELLTSSLDTLMQLSNNTLDIFRLEDHQRIDFSSKTSVGFTYRGHTVAFGDATFLKDVLPMAGWFRKVNKRIGKSNTVLLVETSWPLTSSQKAYVNRHLNK